MKKMISIILFVIVGLNAIAIFVRIGNGEPAGSPAYFVTMLLMLVGGIWLYKNSNQEEVEETTN